MDEFSGREYMKLAHDDWTQLWYLYPPLVSISAVVEWLTLMYKINDTGEYLYHIEAVYTLQQPHIMSYTIGSRKEEYNIHSHWR